MAFTYAMHISVSIPLSMFQYTFSTETNNMISKKLEFDSHECVFLQKVQTCHETCHAVAHWRYRCLGYNLQISYLTIIRNHDSSPFDRKSMMFMIESLNWHSLEFHFNSSCLQSKVRFFINILAMYCIGLVISQWNLSLWLYLNKTSEWDKLPTCMLHG